jgi:hypothetical protein
MAAWWEDTTPQQRGPLVAGIVTLGLLTPPVKITLRYAADPLRRLVLAHLRCRDAVQPRPTIVLSQPKS